jgi:hypothetical protein
MGRTWRGPSQAEDEARRAKGRGNRAAGQTGVPQTLADLPTRAELKKEERPLISRTPRRTKPVAKPSTKPVAADAMAAATESASGVTPAPKPSAGTSRPAPAQGSAPKPKPAAERTEATPATEPAAPPPA